MAALPPIVAAMMRPEFYPERPRRVELIQTHISCVFIAGDFVYKLKKAVHFSFLDCTDIATRRHLCDEEIRLNRRLAPDVYLGRFPIVRRGEDFVLGKLSEEPHDAADYVIKMRRLPADAILDKRLARHEVDVATIHALADVIVKFFRTASSAHATKYAMASSLWRLVIGELMDAEALVGDTITSDQLAVIDKFCRGFLTSHWQLLNARAHNGFVREGHGDLRCEHICIEGAKISIFDCVEFSEKLRTCDIASEIGFLTMDLDRLGAPELGDELVAVIAEATADTDLARLIPFYQCYRAVIRGVVETLRSREAEVGERERAGARELARTCFQLASGYATAATPAILVVCGLSGSGKSTVAKALHHRLGFPIISSDLMRKKLEAIPADENAADAYRAGIYSMPHIDKTYAAMFEEAKHTLGEGVGVILDATFQFRAHRERARQLAEQMKTPILFLECCAEDGEIRRRLIERQRKEHNPSDATVEVYLRQLNEFVALAEIPASQHLAVDTTRPRAEIVAEVQRALRGSN